MDDFGWGYFILGVVAYQMLKSLYLIIDNELRRRREKKFIKLVSVAFPNQEKITYISVNSSDRKAIRDLERQLREDYYISED